MAAIDTELLVVGGNPGGCAAAIAAARSGVLVVLLEPTKVLGGMNANGTFGFDCATSQALSGIAEEVAERVRAHYARVGLRDPLFESRADLVWESHVLAGVWQQLANETKGLTVLTRAVPTGVKVVDRRIREVHWQPASDLMGNVDPQDARRETVRARVVIDASYEGDVTAWAGVPCRLGREPRSKREPHAGRIFTNAHKPSGRADVLLHSILPGSTGEGDESIMAFACRLHCRLYEDRSPGAAHRLQSPPPGYDRSLYKWEPLAMGADGKPVHFNQLSVLVNGKFLLNRMAYGNNLASPARDYILAHPRERKNLRQLFVDQSLGFLYFVQTEGGLPELGLARDEFADNGHLPYQIYVREGRRIEGRFTLSEADVNPFVSGDGLRPPAKADAVAICDWTIESQGCADETLPGYPFPEGYITNRVTRAPFQIPYACMLPTNVDNLIVAGSVSATHVAWSAVRVEAARLHMGLAAGVAGALALRGECNPADVSVDALQAELLKRKVKLTYFADVETSHAAFAQIQWTALRGFVPPDAEWRFEPERTVDWSEFARATVTCLDLPISVTGEHFEGVRRDHEAFRYLEALYDLGTRSGVDLFSAQRRSEKDPMQEFLRLHPQLRLIPLRAGQTVAEGEAAGFLQRVVQCLDGRGETGRGADAARDQPLTRAAMSTLLAEMALRLPNDNAARPS
jgi:hypothetical protein